MNIERLEEIKVTELRKSIALSEVRVMMVMLSEGEITGLRNKKWKVMMAGCVTVGGFEETEEICCSMAVFAASLFCDSSWLGNFGTVYGLGDIFP
ncbi:unnamed protein product [Vicia faba]|uniref:Uncharacterized protein n=1 Tax=Vicia faba TaxID=3906 RepID=A0AAV1A187_VICFA|nr:unnamed protein product [Vicia faba]